MSPALRLAVLVLPLAGLAGAWGWTHMRAQQGTEWEVPVSASGPRASLRGRYVAYRYDWGIDASAAAAVCLGGPPPDPRPVRAIDPADRSCRHVARAPERGLLYVPQEQVPAIRRQLGDESLRAVVRIRVNESGAITPLAIRFERN